MNIAELLKNIDKNVITEETAKVLTEAFETAVSEKAEILANLKNEEFQNKIDEEHAIKLEKLIKAIDKDHSEKFNTCIKTINENHAAKFTKVVNMYKKALNESASKFSNDIVTKIDSFVSENLNKKFPTMQLEKALENTYAVAQLNKIRNILAIGPDVVNENVKKVIVDGKKQFDHINEALEKERNARLFAESALTKAKAEILLEKKTKGMPVSKKEYVHNLLADKSLNYIEENFRYVVEMFDRGEEDETTNLVEEAKTKALSKDAKVIVENVEKTPSEKVESTLVGDYLSELQKAK
jgi:predicted HAD superfamily phosphohydrolase